MKITALSPRTSSRRHFLRTAGAMGLGAAAAPAWAETMMRFSPPLPGGPEREAARYGLPDQRSDDPAANTPPVAGNTV